MQSQENLNSSSLEEVVKRIFVNRKITRADRQRFMAAMISKDALTVEEHEQINRFFDGLRRGVLMVVD